MRSKYKTILIGIAIGLLAFPLSGLTFSGYFSDGLSYYLAIAFNWPAFVANYVLPESAGDFAWRALATFLHFIFYIGLVWLFRFALDLKFRKVA